MAYEVVVCKKQNGSIALLEDIANRAMRRQRVFWTVISSQTIFLTSFRDLCCPPPTSFTACATHCHATNLVLCESSLERLSKKRPRTNLYLRQQDLNFRLSKVFFSLCSSFSSIEIWILACALLYDNDIN